MGTNAWTRRCRPVVGVKDITDLRRLDEGVEKDACLHAV
jgi:hypothetical protein